VEWLLGILVVIVIVILGVWLFIAQQGDAEVKFLVDNRTAFTLTEVTKEQAVFSCQVPFVNKGPQDGTIMDCYPRHLLPQEQFDATELVSWIALVKSPRRDGYFEALIVPKTTGDTVEITLKFIAKNGDIRTSMADMVDFTLDIVYQIVARSEWYITKERMTVTATELIQALEVGTANA